MELEGLMLELKDGNTDALGEIYTSTKRSVYFTVYAILKHRQNAEDIMHETYCIAFEKIAKYKSEGKPLGWICTIARNTALNFYKKNRITVPLDSVENVLIQPEKNCEFGDTIEIAKNVLSSKELQGVLMFAAGGLSHKEISEITKVPYATVRWSYYNSIEKIKKFIENERNSYEK